MAASCLTEDRSTLWLAYQSGGVDVVNIRTGDSTHFEADALSKGQALLLVYDEDRDAAFLITERGVSQINA